jgi:hypothetical protein
MGSHDRKGPVSPKGPEFAGPTTRTVKLVRARVPLDSADWLIIDLRAAKTDRDTAPRRIYFCEKILRPEKRGSVSANEVYFRQKRQPPRRPAQSRVVAREEKD